MLSASEKAFTQEFGRCTLHDEWTTSMVSGRCLARQRSIKNLRSNYSRIPTVTDFEKTPGCFGKLSRPNEGVTDSPSRATLGDPEKTNGQIRHPSQNQKTGKPHRDG